jgi:hypothetical protein
MLPSETSAPRDNGSVAKERIEDLIEPEDRVRHRPCDDAREAKFNKNILLRARALRKKTDRAS